MSPRWKTFLAAAAVVAVANAVALGGVWYNRSGEPESRLVLSEREFARPWGWRGGKENSGLSLSLQWRVADGSADPEHYAPYYGSYGGSPPWLDARRMAELGYDTSQVDTSDRNRRRAFERQSEREVFVVLELAGPAWLDAVERARRHQAKQEALLQASPEAKEFVQRDKQAREYLKQEETKNSRLFAVDVGRDLATLRAKYPDRGRYMILKGKLRPRLVYREKKTVVGGYLSELAGTQIHVPHVLHDSFERLLRPDSPSRHRQLSANEAAPFTLAVRVGQRLEPWIEAVLP